MNYSLLLKPLLRVKDIQNIMPCSYQKAKKIFAAAKGKDNDPYDLRPTQIPTDLLFEVLQLDKRFVFKQIELSTKKVSFAKETNT